ncbi:GNAT family N-acetyltransferase [Chelatococcus reniformis]|uniref:N-acetyltransferase n=1 Tax=Chelatococcus reniformis TaxID=1494448 RepID=A0A916XLF6_9HYPH|nr:GNAT family N-acetyltransferase [Chelatococcus reniformis]GGC83700.1 N-acetyltransferase [Chelatococcus reniformis]
MTAPAPDIVVSLTPDAAEREAIVRPLIAYNDETAGPSNYRPFALLLRDPETGADRGGLWGKTSYDWVFVELLFVPAVFRGQDLGSRLLAQAEEIGRSSGCTGIWLDTFSFQARGFYEKNGYTVFGALEEHPRGHTRYFMRKALTPAG